MAEWSAVRASSAALVARAAARVAVGGLSRRERRGRATARHGARPTRTPGVGRRPVRTIAEGSRRSNRAAPRGPIARGERSGVVTAPRIFTPEYYARMRELESGSWWNAAMRDVAGMLLRDAKLPSAGTVIDVGCGSGQTLTWFTREFGDWRPLGCDIAPEAVAA